MENYDAVAVSPEQFALITRKGGPADIQLKLDFTAGIFKEGVQRIVKPTVRDQRRKLHIMIVVDDDRSGILQSIGQAT